MLSAAAHPSRMHDQSVVTDPFLTRGLGAASPRRAARLSHSAPWSQVPTKNLFNDHLRQDTLVQHYLKPL